MEPVQIEESGIAVEANEAPDGEVLGKMIRDARKEKGLTLEEAEAWLAAAPDGASPEDGLRSHWPEAGATADQTTSGLRHSISP